MRAVGSTKVLFPLVGSAGVTARQRQLGALRLGVSWLALAVVVAAGPNPAHAADECGPAVPGRTVTCGPTGNPTNHYPDGILYGNVGVPVPDLTVVIEDGVIIDTTGPSQAAMSLFGSGDAVVDVGAATISTRAVTSNGVWARSYGGNATITSEATVATEGNSSIGIYGGGGAGGNVTITSTGLVLTRGDNANGVMGVTDGGLVSITTGQVITEGFLARAVRASAFDGAVSVTTTGLIETRGDDSVAIRIDGDEGVSIDAQARIQTRGGFSDGILARAYGGTIDINVIGVGTLGTGSAGMFVSNYGTGAGNTVSITSTDRITTEGSNGIGIFALSRGGAIDIDVVDVTTTGSGATGIYARNYAAGANGAVSVTVTGNVVAANTTARAISVRGAQSHIVITETGLVSSAQSDSINSVSTTIDTVDVHGTLAGTARLNAGDDRVTFHSTADLSRLTLVDAGTGTDALTFNGLAGALDPAIFMNFETITFDNGSDFVAAPAGASTLSASQGLFLSNNSALRLGNLDDIFGSVSIDATSRLVARGDSPGINSITGDLTLAGRLDLTDGAADDRTDVSGSLIGQGGTIALDVLFGGGGVAAADRLTFGGDITGTAFLEINPIFGGPLAGGPVPLITFGGAMTGDIRLAQPLDFGGIVFELAQTGNSFTLALVEQGLVADVAESVALGAAFAPVLQSLFGDLGARIGTGDALRRPGLGAEPPGLWGRIAGADHDGEAGNGTRGVDFEIDQFVLQFGADVLRTETAGGTLIGYAMAQYGTVDGDAYQQGMASTGFSATSYGIGLGATWYAADSGTYADIAGMVNWHDLGITGPDGDAISYTLGIEGGTRLPLGGALSLAPMGQIVYSNADIDRLSRPTMVDPAGAIIFDRAESLVARGNLMLEYAIGPMSSVQFGGGLAYEFLGTSETRFGFGSISKTDHGGFSGEIAARGQVRLSEALTVFGDVRVSRAFDSTGIDSLSGQIGIRMDF